MGPRERLLPLLVVLALAATFGLAFVTVAPNRLVSGRGLALLEWLGRPEGLAGGGMAGVAAALRWALVLIPPLMLAAAALRPPSRARHAVVAVAASAWLAAWTALAGDAAAALRPQRVAFGPGYWFVALLAGLMAADALRRLRLRPAVHVAAHAAWWLPVVALLMSGQLSELALLREWAQRDDVFREAVLRHLEIVAVALAPALALGLPLGVAAAHHERLGRLAAAVLGTVQTVPSIALFGLLIAPLAALGAWWPASGIRGVGLAPAAVALVLYALLPIVLGVAAGLKQISTGVLEAARGMGLGARQRLWLVELPLALPALVQALRVAAVQLVGLAVVAALVGAGGLGSFVFQGLAAGALDLVLLGVVPVVAMALLADAILAALAASLGARSVPANAAAAAVGPHADPRGAAVEHAR
ncbi:MAG: ABC transporter permease [Rubrivivax sp.]|nr:ABC transporter permease [Rubrivivax sp.]